MLSTQHYFSNAVGSVLFVPGSFVYLHWSGEPMSSPELRALYVHARNLLQRNNISGLLADHRAMPTAFSADDQQWLLNEWLPETTTHTHVVRYAALPTQNPARRLHTQAVVQDLRRYLTVELFDNLEQAAAWLATVAVPQA